MIYGLRWVSHPPARAAVPPDGNWLHPHQRPFQKTMNARASNQGTDRAGTIRAVFRRAGTVVEKGGASGMRRHLAGLRQDPGMSA